MSINTWRKYKIAEFVERGEADVQTGPFGTQLKASDYVDSGTPVINVRNIGFGEIREDDLEYVGQTMLERLPTHILEEADIVFARKGAVERHAFVQPQHNGWMQGSDCIRLRISSNSIEPRFLSYYFLTSDHQEWMKNYGSHGATMATLNRAIISQIQVNLPSVETQQRVVNILSNYDRLIDNNTRRIALLEESIHRLYKEWFVYLRFPGCDRVKVFDGVPEEWRLVQLSEVASVNQQTISARNAPDKIQYVDISSVITGKISEVQLMKLADAPSRAKRVVSHGDVIWSMVRPGRRAYSLVLNPPENLIASTGFAVLSAQKVPFSFLYQAVTTDSFVNHMENVATGAAYPAVKPKDFESTSLLIPDENLLSKFDEFAMSINQQIDNLQTQNQKLREARDLLLPQLMNGSIAV